MVPDERTIKNCRAISKGKHPEGRGFLDTPCKVEGNALLRDLMDLEMAGALKRPAEACELEVGQEAGGVEGWAPGHGGKYWYALPGRLTGSS